MSDIDAEILNDFEEAFARHMRLHAAVAPLTAPAEKLSGTGSGNDRLNESSQNLGDGSGSRNDNRRGSNTADGSGGGGGGGSGDDSVHAFNGHIEGENQHKNTSNDEALSSETISKEKRNNALSNSGEVNENNAITSTDSSNTTIVALVDDALTSTQGSTLGSRLSSSAEQASRLRKRSASQNAADASVQTLPPSSQSQTQSDSTAVAIVAQKSSTQGRDEEKCHTDGGGGGGGGGGGDVSAQRTRQRSSSASAGRRALDTLSAEEADTLSPLRAALPPSSAHSSRRSSLASLATSGTTCAALMPYTDADERCAPLSLNCLRLWSSAHVQTSAASLGQMASGDGGSGDGGGGGGGGFGGGYGYGQFSTGTALAAAASMASTSATASAASGVGLTKAHKRFIGLSDEDSLATAMEGVPVTFVARCVINDNDIVPEAPQPDRLNRILRKFRDHHDRFLRVTFRKCSEGRKRVILNRGIVIGGRHFEFLAYTKNQILGAKCWFFAPTESNRLSANYIRNWMGDFSKINAPYKYASRIGLSFSNTTPTITVPFAAVEEVADVVTERNNIQYCFTDGVGQISALYAQRVWQALCDARVPGSSTELPCPSAFQVRFMGMKGMLVMNPHMHVARNRNPAGGAPHYVHLRVRKSMIKFFSPHNNVIEVIQWSTPAVGSLTRQMMLVLSFLGVRDEVLLDRLGAYHRSLRARHECTDTATAAKELDFARTPNDPLLNNTIETATNMLRAGFTARELWLREVLDKLDAKARHTLRTTLQLPIERSRCALGVVDETGRLRYGEVFFQFSDKLNTFALTQSVVVTKSPCMHAGDVRVLSAVDVPELRHIVDCIVFPQRGPRPHSNEIGGSDLDGDAYIICWDVDLVPAQHAQPANWHGSFSYDNTMPPTMRRRAASLLFDETNFKLGPRASTPTATATAIASASDVRPRKPSGAGATASAATSHSVSGGGGGGGGGGVDYFGNYARTLNSSAAAGKSLVSSSSSTVLDVDIRNSSSMARKRATELFGGAINNTKHSGTAKKSAAVARGGDAEAAVAATKTTRGKDLVLSKRVASASSRASSAAASGGVGLGRGVGGIGGVGGSIVVTNRAVVSGDSGSGSGGIGNAGGGGSGGGGGVGLNAANGSNDITKAAADAARRSASVPIGIAAGKTVPLISLTNSTRKITVKKNMRIDAWEEDADEIDSASEMIKANAQRGDSNDNLHLSSEQNDQASSWYSAAYSPSKLLTRAAPMKYAESPKKKERNLNVDDNDDDDDDDDDESAYEDDEVEDNSGGDDGGDGVTDDSTSLNNTTLTLSTLRNALEEMETASTRSNNTSVAEDSIDNNRGMDDDLEVAYGSESGRDSLGFLTGTWSSAMSSMEVGSSYYDATKLLYVAKENFVLYDRYHPDGIAASHLAFMDDKGPDSPEALQLAEQFAMAIKAVKTGHFVAEYKRAHSFPHYMEYSRRFSPTHRSNSILGQMYDAVLAELGAAQARQSAAHNQRRRANSVHLQECYEQHQERQHLSIESGSVVAASTAGGALAGGGGRRGGSNSKPTTLSPLPSPRSVESNSSMSSGRPSHRQRASSSFTTSPAQATASGNDNATAADAQSPHRQGAMLLTTTTRSPPIMSPQQQQPGDAERQRRLRWAASLKLALGFGGGGGGGGGGGFAYAGGGGFHGGNGVVNGNMYSDFVASEMLSTQLFSAQNADELASSVALLESAADLDVFAYALTSPFVSANLITEACHVRDIYHEESALLRQLFSNCPFEVLERIVQPLQQELKFKLRRWFDERVVGASIDFRLAFASAIYVVTHAARGGGGGASGEATRATVRSFLRPSLAERVSEQPLPPTVHAIDHSFPWLLCDCLCYVKCVQRMRSQAPTTLRLPLMF